jgi:hypothetical protein
MTQTINFPTAKLLKEKGFDEFCEDTYIEYLQKTEWYDAGVVFVKRSILHGRGINHIGNEYYNIYSAPTIAEVVVWLYEKYGIWVSVYGVFSNRWFYTIRRVHKDGYEDIVTSPFDPSEAKETLAEAHEVGIKYTLENLIKDG